MALTKQQKTLADYLAIAIAPVLIMALVGSLVFFLLGLVYTGEHEAKLRWVLFWFVLASVLVSRISIEQGSEHATLYGGALAVATALWILRFIDFAAGALCLLAVIWWCASKLTWDSTLIDDDEDASGEGLLQVAGVSNSTAKKTSAKNPSTHVEPPPDTHKTKRTLSKDSVSLSQRSSKNHSKSEGKPHAPGLWVVYFSLAALPLFGIGQALLPANDTLRRERAFLLLWVYVASALGLLLTTSFLGLRRYLRQRNLQMPPSIAMTWVGLGTGLAMAILFICILLPRPEAVYSLPELVGRIGSPPQQASDHALLRDSAGEGKGRPLGGNRRQTSGSTPNQDGGTGENRANERGADNQAVADQRDNQGEPRNTGSERSGTRGAASGKPSSQIQGPKASLPTEGIGDALKWIVYGLFALVALFLLIRNWSSLVAALKQILHELADLWANLFERSRGEIPSAARDKGAARARRFSAFENPFASGAANRMTTEELVRYSFEALQAWALEFGLPRQTQQTPIEFARVVGESFPEIASDALQVAQLYSMIAYAGSRQTPDSAGILERLWRAMLVASDSTKTRAPAEVRVNS
jgi:Domain of unknown function (DUF4129)